MKKTLCSLLLVVLMLGAPFANIDLKAINELDENKEKFSEPETTSSVDNEGPNASIGWLDEIELDSAAQVTHVINASFGTVLVGEYTSEFDHDDWTFYHDSDKDAFVMAFDANLELLWGFSIMGDDDDFPQGVHQESGGEILITGRRSTNVNYNGTWSNRSHESNFVIAIDEFGKLQDHTYWEMRFCTSGQANCNLVSNPLNILLTWMDNSNKLRIHANPTHLNGGGYFGISSPDYSSNTQVTADSYTRLELIITSSLRITTFGYQSTIGNKMGVSDVDSYRGIMAYVGDCQTSKAGSDCASQAPPGGGNTELGFIRVVNGSTEYEANIIGDDGQIFIDQVEMVNGSLMIISGRAIGTDVEVQFPGDIDIDTDSSISTNRFIAYFDIDEMEVIEAEVFPVASSSATLFSISWNGTNLLANYYGPSTELFGCSIRGSSSNINSVMILDSDAECVDVFNFGRDNYQFPVYSGYMSQITPLVSNPRYSQNCIVGLEVIVTNCGAYKSSSTSSKIYFYGYDSDGDAVADATDDFPSDYTQWSDGDEDGFGDNWYEEMYNFSTYRNSYGIWWEDANMSDDCPDVWGNSTEGQLGCPDNDGDGYNDYDDEFPYEKSQWNDTDNDGYGDNRSGFQGDACPNSWGNSTYYRYGCTDQDGDTVSDLYDDFWNKKTQWLDSDGDGLGDNWWNTDWNRTRESHWPGQWVANAYAADPNPLDYDNDGYEDEDLDEAVSPFDDCSYTYGWSYEDLYGCSDQDGDGWSDYNDSFSGDSTQWSDRDSDGYGDNKSGNFPDKCVTTWGNSTADVYGCTDADGDGYSTFSDVDDSDASEWNDADNDGYGDNSDECPYSWGNTTDSMDLGCPDEDGDGWADRADDFPKDKTQWSDSDGDGYGDRWNGSSPDKCPAVFGRSTLTIVSGVNTTWYGCPDSDNDNYEDSTDPCRFSFGKSWVDRLACPDRDGDGISDSNDPYPGIATDDSNDWDGDGYDDHGSNVVDQFPNDRTQWNDTDSDGFGDNSSGNSADAFPQDSTQWSDEDGDGYGDNITGTDGDACPNTRGNSTLDRYGCVDNDGDGYSDPDALWPAHPLGSADSHPYDKTQNSDYDGDGYGDNQSGTQPDKCTTSFGKSISRVNNSVKETWYGCMDSDGDNYEDSTDPCPFTFGTSWVDQLACPDSDNDGISDGNDPYPQAATGDIDDWDGDGYDDHGTNIVDDFPSDGTQWNDTDGDGYGDNQSGNNPDEFPSEFTQWNDEDGDGYGDNPLGVQPDGCTSVSGNSTADRYGCTDTDGDGYSDPTTLWRAHPNGQADSHPFDSTQHEDTDGDGYGDDSSGNSPDMCITSYGYSYLRVNAGANESWYGCPDSDSDGYEDVTDPCRFIYGNSWVDRMACPDGDGDGISDDNDPYPQDDSGSKFDWDGDNRRDHGSNIVDKFPNEKTQWDDWDNDGYGDNPNGVDADVFTADGTQWFDADGDWYGDNPNGDQPDSCINSWGNSTSDRFGCPDTDGDGYSDGDLLWPSHPRGLADSHPLDDTQNNDTDGDGYGDYLWGNNPDMCWQTYGTSKKAWIMGANESWFGCADSDGDDYDDVTDPCRYSFGKSWVDRIGCPDTDNDGISDDNDPLPLDKTNNTEDWDGDGYRDHGLYMLEDLFPTNDKQWNDSDGDGYGDNSHSSQGDLWPFDSTQWADGDGDGYGDNATGTEGDKCPYQYGTSYFDRYGCLDSDGDGYSDSTGTWQAHPNGPADSHPSDSSQSRDTDGDGFGDNPLGNESDAFPLDSDEWFDEDGDGVGDNSDAFPTDSTQSSDKDGDGYGDAKEGNSPDLFPDDSTQWNDTDGDGYGDNEFGRDADAFPLDPSENEDSDGDGHGDVADAFPYNPTQWLDSDGDGYGDESDGLQGDAYPEDSTQWKDSDGDGCGDSPTGTDGDHFPNDPTQCEDRDGDGYGDEPSGRNPDAFPDDGTQWEDGDGDGLGDNPTGNNADPYLLDRDNDGYLDNDDVFPDNPTQWADDDQDGLGDNRNGSKADPYPDDRDNDGYKDHEDEFPLDPKDWADFDKDGIGDNTDLDDDNDGALDTKEFQEGTDPMSSASTPIDSWELILPGTAIGLGAWDMIGIFGGVPLFGWLGFCLLTRRGRTEKFIELLHEAETADELSDIATKYEFCLMLRLIGPHQGIKLERLRAELDDSMHGEPQFVQKQVAIVPPDRKEKGTKDGKGYEWIERDGISWYREVGKGDWDIWDSKQDKP